jgi:hypothetical protein
MATIRARKKTEFFGFCALFEGLKEKFTAKHHIQGEIAHPSALLLEPDHLLKEFQFIHAEDHGLILKIT